VFVCAGHTKVCGLELWQNAAVRISPISTMSRVTLVVITAVDGASFRAICGSAFLHHHRGNAEHARKDPMVAFGSTRGPFGIPKARKPTSSTPSRKRRGRNDQTSSARKPAASNRVRMGSLVGAMPSAITRESQLIL
jgi:hypothetical protein